MGNDLTVASNADALCVSWLSTPLNCAKETVGGVLDFGRDQARETADAAGDVVAEAVGGTVGKTVDKALQPVTSTIQAVQTLALVGLVIAAIVVLARPGVLKDAAGVVKALA